MRGRRCCLLWLGGWCLLVFFFLLSFWGCFVPFFRFDLLPGCPLSGASAGGCRGPVSVQLFGIRVTFAYGVLSVLEIGQHHHASSSKSEGSNGHESEGDAHDSRMCSAFSVVFWIILHFSGALRLPCLSYAFFIDTLHGSMCSIAFLKQPFPALHPWK